MDKYFLLDILFYRHNIKYVLFEIEVLYFSIKILKSLKCIHNHRYARPLRKYIKASEVISLIVFVIVVQHPSQFFHSSFFLHLLLHHIPPNSSIPHLSFACSCTTSLSILPFLIFPSPALAPHPSQFLNASSFLHLLLHHIPPNSSMPHPSFTCSCTTSLSILPCLIFHLPVEQRLILRLPTSALNHYTNFIYFRFTQIYTITNLQVFVSTH